MQAAADIPLLINSPNSSSERRVSPAWTIAQFKTRLEPVTGIPASSQRLTLRVGSQELGEITPAAGNDEESTQLATFPLQALAEIYVSYFVISEPFVFFCKDSMALDSKLSAGVSLCL